MRTQPAQQRSRDTVRDALAAADAEFAEFGYQRAQITRIARRAGVSVGGLYRFFPDKAALAKALADRYLAAASDGYTAMIADVDEPDDVLPAFVRILRFVADLQVEHTGYYRLTSDRPPDDETSWGFSVRQRMVADFAGAIESAGLGATPSVEFVVRFAIEQVRSVLATLSVDGDERAATVDHLQRMVGLYLADQLGLDPAGLG